MFTLRRLEPSEIDWNRLDSFSDRVVFQTQAWLNFIGETQNGEPVIAEISGESGIIGYFSGVIVRKAGIPILGSSFPGWTTPYMGFNLVPGITRASVLPAFERWVFREVKCLHFEVSDLSFTPEDISGLGLSQSAYESYRTDLMRSEEELFNAMTSACRRCIRKAEKSGVVVEQAKDDSFADEYYEQLKDVFAKQGQTPTYGVDRVRALVKHLRPTGNLLLLRACSADGTCIGTGIYPGMNKTAEFWGNASWRQHQHLRPNETLHWYAMRYWKSRGAELFDWGGGGEYKEKYGVAPLRVPWFYKSRYKWVGTARDQLRSLYYRTRPLIGRLSGKKVATAESRDES
jgi:GNAT acetyltransferase-like protein